MTMFTEWPKDGYTYSAADLEPVTAALFKRDSSGNVIPGFVTSPAVTAVASSWNLRVAPFAYLRRSGKGGRIGGVDAAETVAVTPATGDIPSGQSRIDVLVWDQVAGSLEVIKGVPAVSPVPASAGSAAPIAQITVKAGDAALIQAQVRIVAKTAVLGSQADGELKGVANTPGGGKHLASGIYMNGNFTVTFAKPFASTPHLNVTHVADGAKVAQWVQVFALSNTGFSYRVLSVAAAPLAGKTYWTAQEV